MVKIEAILQPFRLDAVKEALHALGIRGITVSEVRGFGRQRGRAERFRGAEYTVDFVPKVKVEVVVDGAQAPEVVGAIAGAARSRRVGDGKIFVSPVTDALRIRTGERGEGAL